jgi:hypothetical protein
MSVMPVITESDVLRFEAGGTIKVCVICAGTNLASNGEGPVQHILIMGESCVQHMYQIVMKALQKEAPLEPCDHSVATCVHYEPYF